MRKSENVVFQERGESLLAVLAKNADMLAPVGLVPNFVHVVSPFAAAPGSETDYVQRLTFHTMARARIAYQALNAPGTVAQIAACFPEDADYARADFAEVSVLTASSLDFAFQVPKKLPLLCELLDTAGRAARDDDYIVLTNTDICLTVGFYDTAASFLKLGFDALVINRRTIEKFPLGLAAIAGASLGGYHPGWDCFVFKAALLKTFVRAAAVIGRGGVMGPLMANLVATAQKLLVLRDVHLTYHLGNDVSWHRPDNADYAAHNEAEQNKVLAGSTPLGRERLRQCGFAV